MIRFLFLITLLIFPHQAMALSCAPPVVNEDVIEQTDLIFEGRAIEVTGNVKDKKLKSSTDKTMLYKFSIEKLWKGAKDLKEVDISKNTYWGDTFKIGTPYLVFASKNGEHFESGLCGNTISLYYAGDKIHKLESYIPTNKKEN